MSLDNPKNQSVATRTAPEADFLERQTEPVEGVWDWSRKSNRCYVSRQLFAMFGYKKNEQTRHLIGWVKRIHRDDWPEFKSQWRKCIFQKDKFFRIEFRILCEDGRYRWLLIRCGISYGLENRTLDRMTGSASDITQKRHTAELLADRTEQLNTVFSLSPDAYVIFDPNHAIKYANPALDKLLGLNSIDVAGWSEVEFIQFVNALLDPKDRLDERSDLKRIYEDRSRAGRFTLDVHCGDTRRALLVHVLQSHSPLVSQILYLKDITHERLIEEMKSAFLSTAAHELRTPMTSILGFSELLVSEHPFSAHQRNEALGSIHEQAQRMTQILDDLLDLSTLETRGRAKLKIQELDLVDLVRSVTANFAVPPGRNPPLQSLISAKVLADSDKSYQAILNILSNGYKYSENGDVEIAIGMPVDHLQHAEIRITDQGLGIAEKDQKRLFERFFRAHNALNIPGTGLGLSIVKEIMTLMGGDVLITSELGSGTVVRLLFPLSTKNQFEKD